MQWKKWDETLSCRGSGSSDDTISMAEHQIQKDVLDTETELWDERMEQEDEITHNKYETMHAAVQRLCAWKKKGAGSPSSTAAASARSGRSLSSGQPGFLPTRLDLKGWGNWNNVRRTAIE